MVSGCEGAVCLLFSRMGLEGAGPASLELSAWGDDVGCSEMVRAGLSVELSAGTVGPCCREMLRETGRLGPAIDMGRCLALSPA